MQGRSRQDRELRDAGEVAGHLVPAGSVFAFLAEHRRELFPDSFTADLFTSRTGRPSLPADLAGSVLVLQALHDLSDGQAADAVKFDIRWKVAKIPVAAITCATASDTRSGRGGAAIRFRQYTSVDGSKLICV